MNSFSLCYITSPEHFNVVLTDNRKLTIWSTHSNLYTFKAECVSFTVTNIKQTHRSQFKPVEYKQTECQGKRFYSTGLENI